MNISFHVGWWAIPAIFALVGIVLCIWTSIATRKEPMFLSAGPLALPNPAGMARYIFAFVLILIGAALAAGHLLH